MTVLFDSIVSLYWGQYRPQGEHPLLP